MFGRILSPFVQHLGIQRSLIVCLALDILHHAVEIPRIVDACQMEQEVASLVQAVGVIRAILFSKQECVELPVLRARVDMFCVVRIGVKEANHGGIVPPDMVNKIGLLVASVQKIVCPLAFSSEQDVSIVVIVAGIQSPYHILSLLQIGKYLCFQPGVYICDKNVGVRPKDIVVFVQKLLDVAQFGPGNRSRSIPYLFATDMEGVSVCLGIGALAFQSWLHGFRIIFPNTQGDNCDRHCVWKMGNV